MSSRLFGIISTSRSLEYTAYCVFSFLKYTPLRDQDCLIIIDNDNSLGELGQILRSIRCVEIWCNEQPCGFAENANGFLLRALELQADLFLLNNDLIFSQNWLGPLLEDDRNILSAVSNREFSYSSKEIEISPAMSLQQYLGKEERFEALVEEHRRRYFGRVARVIVPFFCVKIPYNAFVRIGAFDTSFGVGGGEDFDYCVRAHLMGVDIAFKLQSYVLHFGGRSSWADEQNSEARQAHVKEFMGLFKDKWGEKIFDLVFFSSLASVRESDLIADFIRENNFGTVIKTLLV